MDACGIPFRNEFDMAGAFDVVEHIKDEGGALQELYLALKPGGYLLLSVPQHMFLWSKFDEIGCHFRRYEIGELEEKLEVLGFEIQRSSSFNSLLLPVMILSRALTRNKKQGEVDVLDELRISPFLNKMLSLVMLFENYLVKVGIDLPLGGSRVIVAKKAQD
jgi:SAM-dependent methyltransferase